MIIATSPDADSLSLDQIPLGKKLAFLFGNEEKGLSNYAFNEADVLIVTDIYAAGEKEIEGVNSQKFYQSLKEYGHKDVTFIPKLSDAEKYLHDNLRKNDLFLTMGAGNVWKSGENIINML